MTNAQGVYATAQHVHMQTVRTTEFLVVKRKTPHKPSPFTVQMSFKQLISVVVVKLPDLQTNAF